MCPSGVEEAGITPKVCPHHTPCERSPASPPALPHAAGIKICACGSILDSKRNSGNRIKSVQKRMMERPWRTVENKGVKMYRGNSYSLDTVASRKDVVCRLRGPGGRPGGVLPGPRGPLHPPYPTLGPARRV